MVKHCSKHGDLTEEYIYIRPSGKIECRLCKRQANRKNYYNHQTEYKAAIKEWIKKNNYQTWKHRTPAQHKLWKKNARDKLSNWYIKQVEGKDLPPALIELKRNILKLKRKIFEIKNEKL